MNKDNQQQEAFEKDAFQQKENRKERLQGRLESEVCEFRDSRKTLQLATISESGVPNATYAPFAFDATGYYILVSDLAAHGQNLKSNRRVSILMIEDESTSKNIFARKRLSFDTTAQLVERNTNDWAIGINVLKMRLGEMIDGLSQLGDFNLYRLVPESGRYVKGFGQAFTVSGEDMLEFVHLTAGHLKSERNK